MFCAVFGTRNREIQLFKFDNLLTIDISYKLVFCIFQESFKLIRLLFELKKNYNEKKVSEKFLQFS